MRDIKLDKRRNHTIEVVVILTHQVPHQQTPDRVSYETALKLRAGRAGGQLSTAKKSFTPNGWLA